MRTKEASPTLGAGISGRASGPLPAAAARARARRGGRVPPSVVGRLLRVVLGRSGTPEVVVGRLVRGLRGRRGGAFGLAVAEPVRVARGGRARARRLGGAP